MPMSTPTMPGDHRTTDTAVTTKGGMKDERRRGDYSRFTDQDRRALVAHVTAAHAHHSPCRILRSSFCFYFGSHTRALLAPGSSISQQINISRGALFFIVTQVWWRGVFRKQLRFPPAACLSPPAKKTRAHFRSSHLSLSGVRRATTSPC